MREFLRGKPGNIILVGWVLMAWGFCVTYFVVGIAYGGFLYQPAAIQVVVFGMTGGMFLSGLVLVVFGGYRHCKLRAR
ncbi:MAG: hypothetical protein ABW073_07160 [Acidimicrobiia bacterium]